MQSYKNLKKDVFTKRPGVKKAYKDLEMEYAIIEQLITFRLRCGVTQAELAKKVGTKQSVISRFESGTENPTLGFLRKITDALGAQLSVTIS